MSNIKVCPTCGSTFEGEHTHCPACYAPQTDSQAYQREYGNGGMHPNPYPDANGNPSSVQASPNPYGNAPQDPLPGSQPYGGWQQNPQPQAQPVPYQNGMQGSYQNPPYGGGMGMYPGQNLQNPNQDSGGGLAVAGMVIGIVSILLCCLSVINVALGIAGCILSIIGMRSYRYKGCAIAGLICSICGILLGVLYMLIMLS